MHNWEEGNSSTLSIPFDVELLVLLFILNPFSDIIMEMELLIFISFLNLVCLTMG